MSTSCPFDRNCPVISASRSHATHGWYSVRSALPPPRYSFVAIVKVETCLPDGSDRSSGSRVSRPTSITLFIAMAPSIITAHRGRARPLGEGGYRSALIGGLPPDYCDDRRSAERVTSRSRGAFAGRGDRSPECAVRALPPAGAAA